MARVSDTKYLKRRGNRWFVQIAVPNDVQKILGRAVIIEALGTSDLREAQRLRHEYVTKAHEAFDRARGKRSLTSAEIELESQAKFRRLMAEYDEAVGRGEHPYGRPSDNDENDTWGLQDLIDEVGGCIRSGEYSRVTDDVAEIASRTGATLSKGSEKRRELCRALLKAELEAYRAIQGLQEGKVHQPEGPFNSQVIDPITLESKVPVRARRRAGNGERFSAAVAAFTAESMRDQDARWTHQTRGQYSATYRLFGDYIQDAPLASINREDVAGFLDKIAHLHPDWGRQEGAKGLNLWQLLEKHTGKPGLSNKTLNRHLTALSGLFKWAKNRNQELRDRENPCSGLMRRLGRKSATGWKPYTIDELNTLFSAAPFRLSYQDRTRPKAHSIKNTLGWVSLIALYSGMRSGEVCQLRTTDVKHEQGVWYFDVRDEGGEQRVKTEAAVRKVPVHSQLVRCGFLDYVKSVKGHASGQLFPALKPGGPDAKLNWYFGRAFTTFRRAVGIDREQVGFHSFRKNVGTALERARVPENEAVQILGHEKLSMSYSVYSLGLELKALREIVEKIKYEGLDLGHLTSDAGTAGRAGRANGRRAA